MLRKVAKVVVIAVLAYFGVALGLIVTDQPGALADGVDSIRFDALVAQDYSGMPDLQTYTARDGVKLSYRLYPSRSASERVLILLHGSGWHSMQFYALARAIGDSGAAHVVTPDLRGHGFAPERRGDVEYIGQFEDDLADLIAVLRVRFHGTEIVVGGHSSGGGLAVRFAGGAYGASADAYLLLAPFLRYDAPTTRPSSGGWAVPNSRRIAGLTLLNKVGIRLLNGLTVIQFNMPRLILDGPLGASATTSYSYRLNTAFAPRDDYGRDLAALRQPFLVLAGSADEAFFAQQYQPTISQYTATGTYRVLPDVTHTGILTDQVAAAAIIAWLRGR